DKISLLSDPNDIIPWCEVWLANSNAPTPCDRTAIWNFTITINKVFACFTYFYRPFNERWTTKNLIVERHDGHEDRNFLKFDIYRHIGDYFNSNARGSTYRLI